MNTDLMAPAENGTAYRTLPASTLFHQLGSALKSRATAKAEIAAATKAIGELFRTECDQVVLSGPSHALEVYRVRRGRHSTELEVSQINAVHAYAIGRENDEEF